MNKQSNYQTLLSDKQNLMPFSVEVLQRKCACRPGSGSTGVLQRAAVNSAPLHEVPPIVDETLRSPGQPLDLATRQFMEPRFGHNFSNVRVHSHAKAAESAQAVNALAYTVGRDVVFGAGQYAPQTRTGRGLLAHELTHVVQQSSRADISLNSPITAYSSRSTESEAETAAQTVITGGSVAVASHSVPQLARQPARPGGDEETTQQSDAAEPQEASPSTGADQTQAPAASSPCNPRALARADYLQEEHTTEEDLGLTRLAGTATIPVAHTTRVRGGVRLDMTAAALPPITSVYTAAGSFEEREAILSIESDGCPPGRYPIHWLITADGARKIRDGELEHCADFQYAFDISIKRYAEAVNALSSSGRVFASQRAAERHLTRQVGVEPDRWSEVFHCLVEKTRERDGSRGNPGWHTPRPIQRPPTSRNNCTSTFVIAGSSLPQVGQHPPSEIVKDCREVPQRRQPRSRRRRGS